MTYSEPGGMQHISIHALREEGDDAVRMAALWPANFYPRPPRGGRPMQTHVHINAAGFLSTPSARRATSSYRSYGTAWQFLSTPSARRATPSQSTLMASSANFYPRPPRGGRPKVVEPLDAPDKFLSTPSARRATAKTETKSLFSNKLYNILHEFRRALIYNGSKNYPNHAK